MNRVPDYKAYTAAVEAISGVPKDLAEALNAADDAYRSAMSWAAASEQRANEIASNAAERITQSLGNARRAVDGLAEDTQIPPRMRASETVSNVAAVDVERALADLTRAVIALNTLSDQIRNAPPPRAVEPEPVQVKPEPTAPRRGALPLILGGAAIALMVLVLALIFVN
ncbi:MAG: hypothetical protein LCH87_14595 [Actinobacteria bacterium]|nr:hypothetical protein [Actinomycetota bacterium]